MRHIRTLDDAEKALLRCASVGDSSVKEIVAFYFTEKRFFDCTCVIEMGTFRRTDSHCVVCGGIIG